MLLCFSLCVVCFLFALFSAKSSRFISSSSSSSSSLRAIRSRCLACCLLWSCWKQHSWVSVCSVLFCFCFYLFTESLIGWSITMIIYFKFQTAVRGLSWLLACQSLDFIIVCFFVCVEKMEESSLFVGVSLIQYLQVLCPLLSPVVRTPTPPPPSPTIHPPYVFSFSFFLLWSLFFIWLLVGCCGCCCCF